MENLGNPIEEYKDVSENMRHYANMRFAKLTVFFALTGGLVALLNKVLDMPFTAKAILIIGGVYIAVIFWVMEERDADYWHYLRGRAENLEKSLGFRQYTDRPKPKLLKHKWATATNATRALYIGIIIFWIVELIFELIFKVFIN